MKKILSLNYNLLAHNKSNSGYTDPRCVLLFDLIQQ
ncbi:hypothetical protein SLEP1_g4021 [Rubroshorea leprosula]|uniref:Uncharacterized protein n=1 Tax=Rubroshorea leprosula TaxID=152421 RepID=A0AAV5HW27_9ROSI|nr:hypothetical protein SLEP1_g4021 [Rubroshorea leprosula]